jgi:hypothetical protein
MLTAKLNAKIRRNLITGLACSGVFLSLQSRPAAAANPVTTITVGDVNYDVTYFTGSYNNNTAKFTTADMPWWDNQSLAETFAAIVEGSLGTPNPPPPIPYGPQFAFEKDDIEELIFAYANYGSSVVYGSESFGNTNISYATAKVSTPSSVPGPLPLGGAVALFGVSRRLRSRIRLGQPR